MPSHLSTTASVREYCTRFLTTGVASTRGEVFPDRTTVHCCRHKTELLEFASAIYSAMENIEARHQEELCRLRKEIMLRKLSAPREKHTTGSNHNESTTDKKKLHELQCQIDQLMRLL